VGVFAIAGNENYLTSEQVRLLLKPIHPQRVRETQGMSHVEGYDIRAELNRVFGFCRWSEEILHQSLICEYETKTNAGRDAWCVVYNTRVRLTIYSPEGNPLTFYDGSHVGESTHPSRGEAHGNAITNSATYALRRAAINLGDQFGLGLYNKGSLDPIVRWTLVGDLPADTDDVARVEAEAAESEPEPAEEKKVPSSPRPPRKAPAKAEETIKSTPDSLTRDIMAARTVEVLRQAWKDAGETGFLQSKVTITDKGTGEKETVTVQDLLYRRHEELDPPKSNGAGNSSAQGSGNAASEAVAAQ
jgi:recombination DNA repair RAD52 pathway protein